MKKVKRFASVVMALALASIMPMGAMAEAAQPASDGMLSAWQVDYNNRLSDSTVNTAQEYLDVLQVVNRENGWDYRLPAGPANELEEYLIELNLSAPEFKEQLIAEIQYPQLYPNGMVVRTKLSGGPALAPTATRDEIHQTTPGILTGSSGSCIAYAYLDSVIFSATGAAGSYSYERITGYGPTSGQSISFQSSSYSLSGNRKTATVILSGYVGLSYMSGQFPFSAG